MEEDGGMNLYAFVDNDPISSADLLGCVINARCPLDDYLASSLGLKTYKSSESDGNHSYYYEGQPDNSSSMSLASLIVSRMMLTKFVFTVDGSSANGCRANLEKHVKARIAIVNSATAFNMSFSGDRTKQTKVDQIAWRKDAQKYFNSLNKPSTFLACNMATWLVFETGNAFSRYGTRIVDDVWIPGDWPYMKNKADDKSTWDAGLEGENMIHVGVKNGLDQFWGSFNEIQVRSEADWKNEIRSWHSKDGKVHGDPAWGRGDGSPPGTPPVSKYTGVGLKL
jgi:hypothetical protein